MATYQLEIAKDPADLARRCAEHLAMAISVVLDPVSYTHLRAHET